MRESRGWFIYQVVLFLAVWAGWYYACTYIDADDGGRIYAPRTDTNTYFIGLIPALIVWAILAKHRRATLIFLGIVVGSVGSFAVLGLIWLFIWQNLMRTYGVALAFPLLLVWLFLLRVIWVLVHESAPDE